MRQKIRFFLLFVSLIFTSYLKAENLGPADSLATISNKDELLLLKADDYFDAENYVAAMSIFDTLSKHYPQSVMFKLNAGICYLHASSKHDLSLTYLQEVKKRKPDLEGIDYYLGRAYLYNYFYDEAIACFQKYSEIPVHHNQTKFEVAHFIDYCNHGKVLIKSPVKVSIDNIGKPINTDNSEYVPVIASDESFMIFTYRGERSKGGKQNANNRPDEEGEYYEDIFISYRVGDHWLDPEPLGNINTIYHDAAIALSVDGQKLFIFKATKKDNGDIYISELKGSDWTLPKRLNKNINTEYWEGSITMSNDEKTIYFSSTRPGGYGGRDLYKSSKQADGEWGPAINLGAKINTKYNEDAPFLHPDGKLFYFSSEGHNSSGGYDIFKSEVVGDTLTAPENMGFPINTSTDDKYISITSNGARAYYSSGVDEGLGQQDIYSITPGIAGKKPQVAILKGHVKGNENPISAQINVTNLSGEKNYGTFYSNAESGNYFLILHPSENYKIKFKKEGYPEHTEYVSNLSLRTAVELEQDIHLYTTDYNLAKANPKDTLGFIYSQLEEKILKLGNQDVDDDNLIAEARAQEAERRQGIAVNSASYRVATEATVKHIIEQNYSAESLAKYELKNQNEPVVKTQVAQDTSHLNSTDVSSQAIENKQIQANLSETSQKSASKTKDEVAAMNTAKDSLPENNTFGVFYKVQIGAYRHPQNFNYNPIKPLGSVESLLLNDGITRFTIGNFETLADARNLQQKIIEKGIQDAWITATINGERKFLEELRKMNLKVIN